MRAEEAARRALAAVARLTILAGAAGCAGNVIVEEEETTGALDPGESDPNDPPDLVMDPPGECFEAGTDTAACCTEVLTKSFTDGPVLMDPTLATEQERACCGVVVTTMDTWAGPGLPPFDYSLTSTCCSLELVENPWTDHVSCTPWGPPMPPAMPRAFDLSALEALS